MSDRRALLVVVPVLILASSACRGSSSGPDRQSAPPDPAVPRSLLIVTIDTLRADRIGAYGYAAGRTPAIDRLAARGVRFDRAFAPAPITLTSHASLLTGLYPPGHGARHNGMRVAPGVGTLAEILKAHGFATGAFVGAFPLDRRFGLDRGFDLYSDTMPRAPDGRVQNERPGDEVVDAARAWLANLAGREQSPFFLWLHLFEPHAPYVADPARGPAGRSLPASDRYDDEIARADGLVGRIVEVLGARAASTLVVFTSDHGEAFGEHGEIAHSVFVYDTTLRVPLIVAGPGIQAGLVAAGAVSLVDVVPTVLDLLKLPRHDTDGVSLRGTLAGEALPAREIYAESFAPLLDFGWSALRSLRSGGEKFIAAPASELYDVAADPGELRNLVADRPESARTLAARVDRYSGPELPESPSGGSIDRDTAARLQAIGYLSGGRTGGTPGARPDPKDRRDLAARIAHVTSGELQGKALRAALEAIVRDDPGNGQAHLRLGYVLLEARDCQRAEPAFRTAIAAGVPSTDAHLGLAQCLGARRDVAGAKQVLLDARAIEPGNPVVAANLGIAALAADRPSEAIGYLASALAVAPDLHEARFTLARAYAREGRRAEAAHEARTLLSRLPPESPQRAEVERLLRALQ